MSKSSSTKSLGRRIFDFLAGFEIAVICFVLLIILTFFGTWEQQYIGLYRAIEKYFDLDAFIVIPRNGDDKIIFPPLPGAYWVIVVLSVNMFLGGILRIRKGVKQFGVLVTHFSILFMLVAGAVSSIFKREGVMLVFEGEKSDYATDYHDYTIEVFEYDENGDRTAPKIIENQHLRDMERSDTLVADFEGMPFDLKVTGYLGSAEMYLSTQAEPQGDAERVIDGFFIRAAEPNPEEELNMAGCYITVEKEEGESRELLLYGGNNRPISFNVGNKRYGITLVRRIWPMPFEVELHQAIGRYHPGTRNASWFQSNITKVTDGSRKDYEIVMNKPMRHGGHTLFQANWDEREGRAFSGFAIVNNPSDKWPEWSLYIATIAMFLHFAFMLGRYILSTDFSKTKS